MSVKIKGIKELEASIQNMMPARGASSGINRAVNTGGDRVVSNMKKAFESFKDTGASRDEITRSNARAGASHDDRRLKIGWNGPKGRWRMVHLNEFGYTRHGRKYTPRGFGVIEKTVKESEKEYFSIVLNELKKVLNG